MVVGITKVTVHLLACFSLKDKRSEISRIFSRIKQKKIPVAYAEVGKQDKWQLTELGFTCVSTDPNLIERVLNQAVDEIESKADAEVMDEEREVIHF